MRKTALALVASAALLSASALSASATDLAFQAGVNNGLIGAGQLNTGLNVGTVTKNIELTNQGVGVSLDFESAQKVKNLGQVGVNNAPVIALQGNGPIVAAGVGGTIKATNVGAGVSVSAKLTK